MQFTTLIATAAAVLPGIVDAHGGVPGAPQLFGRNAIKDLKARGVLRPRVQPRAVYYEQQHQAHEKRGKKQARQSGNTNGQCGGSFGACAEGYCCSVAGWCGQGNDYCAAPGCQFNYGPGCDANTVPPGTNTSTVARDQLGSVAYGGTGIYNCQVPGTIALTYDDGPFTYTAHILDLLKQYNAKATFFITGNNNGKGEIDNEAYPWVAVIQRMAAEGHQIASHTWSHQDLSKEVTQAQRKDQMYKNEMALRNILGYFPTYMRPPYSSCDAASGCQDDMVTLGYHVTYFDLDTEDYLKNDATLIQDSKNDFLGNISSKTPDSGEWLAISHDIDYQTAYNLTEYMLQTLQAQGYTAVTVGECLGDPKENWYRNSAGSTFSSVAKNVSTSATATSSAPVVTATAVSTNGTCGGDTGFTCAGSQFGNCCSSAGWCGSSTAHCDTGCQPAFGVCGLNGSATTTSSAPNATASLKVSDDGSCGASTSQTCQGSTFGNCCSQYGWCGSTDGHCGDGCQNGYGTCGSGVSSSGSVSSTVTESSSSSASASVTVSSSESSVSPTSSVSSVINPVTSSSTSSGASGSSSSSSSTASSTGPTSTHSGSSTTSTSRSSTLSTSTRSTNSISSVIKPSSTSSTPTPTPSKSTNGQCGAKVNMTCKGYPWGQCCGAANRCGAIFECMQIFGCQSKYGMCF